MSVSHLLLLFLLCLAGGCAHQPTAPSRCWVHLFDRSEFDVRGSHDIVFGPDRWSRLDNLPNAFREDWTGAVASLITGPAARVWVWDGENFQDSQAQIEPCETVGNHRSLSLQNISSLAIECLEGRDH